MIGMIPAMLPQLGGLQIIFYVLFQEFYTMYLGFGKPFRCMFKNIKFIVAQAIIMIMTYNLIMMSDFVVEPK